MSKKFDREKFKNNCVKIGNGVGCLLKENSGTIVGGFVMIGMALLCKKFEVPYQVLTDPFVFSSGTNSAPTQNTKLVIVPNNALEASMGAIYDGISKDDWESTKENAARRIFTILSNAKENSDDDISEGTKTYAINLLKGISDKSSWNSTKDHINTLIAKIGMNNY